MEKQQYSPKDKLPAEDKAICFYANGELFEGTFIPREHMFFIGFGDCGDFRYTFEVDCWFYKLSDISCEICIKKCTNFPKCEPCGTWFSKM